MPNNPYTKLAKRIRNEIPDKMKGLLHVLPGAWVNLKIELLAFADYLDALADEE